MLSSDASYGAAHCAPPTRTRFATSPAATGNMEWLIHSKPSALTSRRVPSARVSFAPLARWYTTARISLENGVSSLSPSMKYCWISGRIDSSR